MDGMTATTPFLEFRLWWRRASAGKQSAAVGAVAVVIALIVWIAVPLAGGGPSSNLNAGSNGRGFATGGQGSVGTASAAAGPGTTTGTAAATGPGATGSTGAGAAVGANGGGAGGATSGSAVGSVGGCSGPQRTMNVGVVLIDVGGLDSAFGLPSVSGQQAMWNAMFDSINKSGGAACQKLAPDFQTYDELNPSTAQNGCLAFVQHHDFAVLGGFLPTSPDTCMLQNHIPVFEETVLSTADVQKFYPYYFSGGGALQVVYRNWAYASRQLNAFNPANGFKKLGIFYRDCQPEVNAAMLADLQAVGVPSSAIDRYDLGCPAAFASPSQIEQGVVKFKSDGVTTATIDNDSGDQQNITKQSQAQGFRPQWTIPDDGAVAVSGSASMSPDPNNFDNALAITPAQYGANNTPGFKESPTDVACDQIMTSHGQPGVMASGDQFAGAVCNLGWMFAAAAAHAPNLAPDQLAAGLQRAGSVPFSFPYGPNNFSAQGTTFGGELWRPVTYHASCRCWQLDSPNFSPSF
jgi:hypothetical protein